MKQVMARGSRCRAGTCTCPAARYRSIFLPTGKIVVQSLVGTPLGLDVQDISLTAHPRPSVYKCSLEGCDTVLHVTGMQNLNI